MQYEFHEVANIFPMMSESEFSGLVEDIRKNSQIEPIWVYDQKIIDGRNRYNACLEIGIEPVIKEWNGKGSLVSFVTSLNLHRRHLNYGQLHMLGLKIKPIFEEEARIRRISSLKQNTVPTELGERKTITTELQETVKDKHKGESAREVANLIGGSATGIYTAQKIVKEGIPDIVKAVENGNVSLDRAGKIVKLPKEEQSEALVKAINKEPIKVKLAEPQLVTPAPPKELGYMEGAEALHEILQNISSQLGMLIGHAETELLSLPKSTVKNARHQIEGCVDTIHKCAERLEISLKMCK